MVDKLDLTQLVRDGDLTVYMSFAFVCSATLGDYLKVRELIENEIGENNLIHSTVASNKLFVVKERDYDMLQKIKQNGKYRSY